MGPTPFSMRNRPAGESFLIEPAGEMWSVVTESPTMTSTRAPLIAAMGLGVRDRFTKKEGSWMYVLFASQLNNSPPLTGIAFHCSLPLATLLYCRRNMSGERQAAMVS